MINVDRTEGLRLVTDAPQQPKRRSRYTWQVSFANGRSVYVQAFGHASAIEYAYDACNGERLYSPPSPVVLVRRLNDTQAEPPCGNTGLVQRVKAYTG